MADIGINSASDLLRFQEAFIKNALAPGVRSSALSIPRGNGKTTLAAWLTLQTITPGSELFTPGSENHLVAASLGQCRRTTFGVLRRMVEALPNTGDYRISDNTMSARIRHPLSRTEVSVLPASGKSAMGLVNARWLVADEPASWKPGDGQVMFDAIEGAHGKPGSGLRVLYVGTLAPATEGHWWTDLVEAGSIPFRHVTSYQGDRETWDQWPTIQKANPLMSRFKDSRTYLLGQRDRARTDSRLRALFLSYRLNIPTRDDSEVVLRIEDWERVAARPPAVRQGSPVVALDIGAARAWSAAVAIWPDGRCEALAVCPGIPSIADQEHRDQVQPGTYERLIRDGSLIVADGKRVPPVSTLLACVADWSPGTIVCDRFRLSEVLDAAPPCPVIDRIMRWSQSTEDITALRRMAADGPLSVAPASRSLLMASLAVSRVRNEEANVRLVKSPSNTARDDVSAALILAAGEWARRTRQTPPKLYYTPPQDHGRIM